MENRDINKDVFNHKIEWEIRFKHGMVPPDTGVGLEHLTPFKDQAMFYIPSPDLGERELINIDLSMAKEAQDFLQKFQQACDQVKQEYLAEAQRLEEVGELTDEQYVSEEEKVDKSLEALNDLVQKFKGLMDRFKKDNQQE